jgi:hypothetical protein
MDWKEGVFQVSLREKTLSQRAASSDRWAASGRCGRP